MAEIVIFNPSPDTQCIYTEQGHMIGGGERRTVQDLDSVGRDALRREWIIIKRGVLPPPPLWPATGEEPHGGAEEEAAEAQDTGGESGSGGGTGGKSTASLAPAAAKPKNGTQKSTTT